MRDQTVNIGGNANVGAIGNRAKGTVNVTQSVEPRLADIDRRLDELRSLLEQHHAELADAPSAHDAIDLAAEELRADNPDPKKFRVFLNSVAAAAPGVGAVARSAKELVQLLATALP